MTPSNGSTVVREGELELAALVVGAGLKVRLAAFIYIYIVLHNTLLSPYPMDIKDNSL